MKRLILSTLGALLIALGGCEWMVEQPVEVGVSFALRVVPPLTVVVDGSGVQGGTAWFWDWGDGEISGPLEIGIASHTYAAPGRYVVIMTVEGTGVGGGAEEDLGPGPGAPPPVGTPGVAAAYAVADVTGGDDGLYPVLFFTSYGRVANSFYPGERVCVNAQESIGEELTYRIEIVRVVSKDDPTPIPYSWAGYTEPTIRRIISEGPTFCWYIDGPGGCSGEQWTFMVTLRIRDKYWNEASITKFVFSGCCP